MSTDERSESEVVEELLAEIVGALGLTATVAMGEDADGVLTGTITGEELGVLIGRHGQTIDAIQHIAQRVLTHRAGEPRRLVIDAEGYRARRREALERQANQAADEALRYGRAVSLDAMAAPERKVVHEYLRDRGDVETHSEGDEPDRRLVVSPLAD